MKKIITLLLLSALAVMGQEFIVTSPTNSVYRRSKASYNTNTFDIFLPAGVHTTNGASSFINVTNLSGPFQLLASNIVTVAVGGAANSNQLARLDSTGKFDTTMIPSSSSSKAMYSTNLPSDTSLTQNAFTQVFSFTTTKGSGAVCVVNIQGGIDTANNLIAGLWADGPTNWFVGGPSGWKGFVQGSCSFNMVSNTVIHGGFLTENSAVTLKKHPIPNGTTLTNATTMGGLEF